MMTIKIKPNCADNPEFGTLPVNDALARILAAVQSVTGYEKIPVQEACGRVLYHAVHSFVRVPPFTNSAMDGFALNRADLPPAGQTTELVIIGTALAGKPFESTVGSGETVRVMTGAVIPDGADTVVIQEHVEISDQTIRIDARHTPGQNVRQAGEDIQPGDCVLEAGLLCAPADVGIIASMGIAEVSVYRKLRVAVFSTGSEVCDLGQQRAGVSQQTFIYDSNRYSLCAALGKLPIEVVDMGIIPDDPALLQSVLLDASHHADLIITSGGVSVGEADYTKQVLSELGSVDFWTVAMKPGRPIAFGKINSAVLFGLPGNPVAVMVTWCFLLKPALEKMLGISASAIIPSFIATSTSSIRKRSGRTEFQRGILTQQEHGKWTVKTTGKQGSGILTSMSKANAFIVLEHDRGGVEAGDEVLVYPFSGLF
ncbi:MAG TPA: molybdopterin molybdenumtransferase MoeA [Crenotrichaceae bacterium]|nr:molybdopterin molybdenumtransferase MoeA [Crenotrichaceae bacterium]